MLKLLNSTAQPVGASSPQIAREWGDVQESYLAMHFATQRVKEFLEREYTTEDDIKTALKISQSSPWMKN